MTIIYSRCMTCGQRWAEEDSIPWTRSLMLRNSLVMMQGSYAMACPDPVHEEVLDRLERMDVVS